MTSVLTIIAYGLILTGLLIGTAIARGKEGYIGRDGKQLWHYTFPIFNILLGLLYLLIIKHHF